MIKPYTNRTWMYNKFVTKGMSAAEIAKECNTSEMTIDRWLGKHGLKRNKRSWSRSRK